MFASPHIQYAVLGWSDSLILMVMALVVFGPRRLPQIGRQIGKLMYEFRKASNDFKFQMEEELRLSEDADRRKTEEQRQQALAAAAPTQSALPQPSTPEAVPSPYPGEEVYPPVVTDSPAAADPVQPAEPAAEAETKAPEPVTTETASSEPAAQTPPQEASHG